jgi:hypothetical protein
MPQAYTRVMRKAAEHGTALLEEGTVRFKTGLAAIRERSLAGFTCFTTC